MKILEIYSKGTSKDWLKCNNHQNWWRNAYEDFDCFTIDNGIPFPLEEGTLVVHWDESCEEIIAFHFGAPLSFDEEPIYKR